jgi:hypothetical protein
MRNRYGRRDHESEEPDDLSGSMFKNPFLMVGMHSE